MHRLHLSVIVVAACLLATPASADLIDFTTLPSSSGQTLVFGNVTITGDEGAFVANVEGEGLGLVGVGRDSAIERILEWDAGANWNETRAEHRDGELTIQVNGTINAMTILPFMTIVGPQPAQFPGFQMSFTPVDGNATTHNFFFVQPFVPITFPMINKEPFALADVGLFSDFGQEPYFSSYRRTFNYPESTITFGYSILSLDYTPKDVPEPTTLALLATGGLVTILRRRFS